MGPCRDRVENLTLGIEPNRIAPIPLEENGLLGGQQATVPVLDDMPCVGMFTTTALQMKHFQEHATRPMRVLCGLICPRGKRG